MRERIRILLVIYGLLLTVAGSTALKPTRPKFKIATTSTSTSTTTTTTTDEPQPEEHEVTTVQTDVNATTRHTLTGIPQIDYVWDPNLPRELNGFNLSSYPFYSTVPDLEDIDFKCDGLHDGFYASIQHQCQLYHHCLYGTRYDFLCANFTAFDQRTFICHFASEVDCANSKNYWHRNDALYQATTTTTTSTTTTTTVAPPATAAAPIGGRPLTRERDPTRRRRPFRRRQPAYEYYDDEYYDDEYDRTRPRGYDRRDSYDYDDRNYRTDRDRDRDRDRDYRDPVRDHVPRSRERDSSFGHTPSRDADNRRPAYDDRDQQDREKVPAVRPGRRDRRPVDQFDEDSRPLVRDRPRVSNAASYPDMEKVAAGEERRQESSDARARDSTRDMDDRRYSDPRSRNDYDDKDPVPIATGANDGLVKPSAPSTSVYARPRAAPKIRRPVPVSEKNKYAYNVSAGAASVPVNDESRRRPDPVDDDYVEDDLEDVRPRRPIRRRPAYRDKEPSYDARETRDRERDRDRDRNFRTRYQDENEEEVQPRKRPDRQRDRQYERGDRLHSYDRDIPTLDRGAVSPVVTERPTAQPPSRFADRPSGLLNTRPLNRDKDFSRPKFPIREREPPVLQSEAPKRANFFRQRTERPTTDNIAQTFRKQDDQGVEEEPIDAIRSKENREKTSELRFSEPEVIPELILKRPLSMSRGSQKYEDSNSESQSDIDYPSESSSEYYDEPEELPASSPRSTLRIVKRPFLPSRGGNPNPRGLKQVGLRVEPRSEDGLIGRPARINPVDDGTSEPLEDRSYNSRRQPYDAYRTIQPDDRQQNRDPLADDDVVARPQSRRLQKEDSSNGQEDSPRSSIQGESSLDHFDNRDRYNNRQSSQLRNGQSHPESSQQEGLSTIRSQENSEVLKPNEVESRLEEIPESEYDVTLNDALTPTLTQESSLPSGFILPLHRQLERDTNLQSSQRNYLFTRPTEPVSQLKSLPSSGSSSYPVPPIVERSRSTFPRQSQGSILTPGHQQAPWQGYVEY